MLGAAHDTLAWVAEVVERELNGACDNPLWFDGEGIVEVGNFHGAPVGYVLDFLAIAVADLGSMAERRTDRMLDKNRSHGLPPVQEILHQAVLTLAGRGGGGWIYPVMVAAHFGRMGAGDAQTWAGCRRVRPWRD